MLCDTCKKNNMCEFSAIPRKECALYDTNNQRRNNMELTRKQKIEALENEIAALKAEEAAEKERERKALQEEKATDLNNIKELLAEYNKKYNDALCLGISRTGDFLSEIFSWL